MDEAKKDSTAYVSWLQRDETKEGVDTGGKK